MIDTVLNLLFRCGHRRLTRPVTLVDKTGVPGNSTYVVCLECGKQFAYDTNEMRLGKALPPTQSSDLIVPEPAKPNKLKYVFLSSVPLAVLIASRWGAKRRQAENKTDTTGSRGDGPNR